MTNEEAAEGIRKFRNSISRNAEIFRSPDPWVQTISMYSAKIMYGYEFIEELNMAIAALENAPKKGKWIYKYMEGQFCSCCDKQSIQQFNFCPYCGADMRGE